MKKYIILLFLASSFSSVLNSQSLTTVILPQYIEGVNGTNSNRLPFAYRVRLTGLTASATYHYYNQVIIWSDAATSNGAGNCIFTSGTGNFVRTGSPGLVTAGTYGSFTTDVAGAYEGWFITEPTGNATRFIPGKYIFMRIILNDGLGGTTVGTRLTTADSVRVVNLTTATDTTAGTGLRCTSSASPKDFVFAYDNTAGTGRPISGSFIEDDGTANTTANSYAAFYFNSVDAVSGAFGMILPNILPNGIRRIEDRSLAGGTLVASATDADGIWPSGANTVNPSGGTNEIVLAGADAPLPVELVSFTAATTGSTAMLKWSTATEVNNYGFEVERRVVSSQNPPISFSIKAGVGWGCIGFVNGNGTSNSPHNYIFGDNTISTGTYAYRLKQVDNNGSFQYSQETQVTIETPRVFALDQNFPNPFNPTTAIKYQVPINSRVELKVYDVLGREVETLVNERQNAGEYSVTFDASNLTSGVYFYSLHTEGFIETKEMVLIK